MMEADSSSSPQTIHPTSGTGTPRRPEPHFSRVWYASMANVAILTLPLEWLGLDAWTAFCGYYSVFAFGFFLSAEWAAPGVRSGFSGTKTSWLFRQVPDRLPRVLIGVWIAALMFWRFPDWWPMRVIAWGFLAWLPWHYWERGLSEGPVLDLLKWLGGKLGIRR